MSMAYNTFIAPPNARMINWRPTGISSMNNSAAQGRAEASVSPKNNGDVYMFCRWHQFNGPSGSTPAYYSSVFPVSGFSAPNDGTISYNMLTSLKNHVERTYRTKIIASERTCETGSTPQQAESRKAADQRMLLNSGYAATTRVVETLWTPN